MATVAEVSLGARGYVAPVEVALPLADGDVIAAGATPLTVAYRPGHSPGDALFLSPAGWALSGDHLLARVAPATIAHLLPGEDPDPRRRPSSLLAYRESLAASAAVDLTEALPGHGPLVEEPRARIAAVLAAQERRARRVRDTLRQGAATAWELATWGGVAGEIHPMSAAFVALCDVLGHLDLLVDGGYARLLDGDPVRYEAAAPARLHRAAASA